MSTRFSARNLFPPLDNPKLTIRRRSHADPTLLNYFEIATEGNGDPPVPDLRTVKELCQLSLNGNDANKHLDKFLHVTHSIKVNEITDDALRLYLFPHSLTHHATAWFDRLPRNSINTFKQMAKMFLGNYFLPSMDTSDQWSESSSSITSSFDQKIVALKAEIEEIDKKLMRVLQVNQQVKAVTPNCETCGGPHSYNDCPTTIGQTQNVYAAGAYQGVERETEVTKDKVPPTNNGSTKDVQPLVFQVENPILNSEPVVAPISEPVVAPTKRALIDVFKGELTLRVGKEAITFNLDQTSRYSTNYNDMTANRINVIDMACEEYSQEVLGFFDMIDLPPYLEYAFLEGDDKFPVIIAKDLNDEEKTTLIKVLKSHKRAIAWKLFDIKGINLEICTHKILMEEDFKPVVQHQRRFNLKIHDVIKNEVEKLLDAG
nr:reverse transcriptase domain-containing protein [Tanacetum cinerariifolium]